MATATNKISGILRLCDICISFGRICYFYNQYHQISRFWEILFTGKFNMFLFTIWSHFPQILKGKLGMLSETRFFIAPCWACSKSFSAKQRCTVQYKGKLKDVRCYTNVHVTTMLHHRSLTKIKNKTSSFIEPFSKAIGS